MASSSHAGAARLEDIYQEEVINAFMDLTQFKMFARSKNGLCLDASDVQNCDEDNENSIDKKMAMLSKWQMKNGKDATVPRIRYLVERYHKGDKPENYMTLREDMFGLFKDKKLSEHSHVYLGEQISTVTGSIPRAIKLIPYEENSLREAKILTKLGTHENVVSVIHADKYCSEPNDYIYIVMELASSKNLRDLLEETKKSETLLHDKTAIDLAIQILKALVFIHKKNIIHRDLKAENILVSEDGKELKLTDFGISKTIRSGSYTNQTSKDCGTDGFRSPETYNEDVISQKSDIFSAGITVAELFSNSWHPFGDKPLLWNYLISSGKTPDLSHILIANKAPVEKLIRQMLLFDPEERPTAEVVLNVLQLLLHAMNPAVAMLPKMHPVLSSADEQQEDRLLEDFQTDLFFAPEVPTKVDSLEIQSGIQVSAVENKVHFLTSASEIQPGKDGHDPALVTDASTVKEIQTQVQTPAAKAKEHLVTLTSESYQTGKSPTPAVRQKTLLATSTTEEVSEDIQKFRDLPDMASFEEIHLATTAIHRTASTARTNEIIFFCCNDKHMHSYRLLTREWTTKHAYHVYPGYDTDWGNWFTTLLVGVHIFSLHRNKIYGLNYFNPYARWYQVKDMSEDHGFRPPAAVLNGSIHVCGISKEVSQSVERFEERENKWIALPPYQVARRCHCIVASKDHIYCIGGQNAKMEPELSVERFDGERWEFVEQTLRELTDASATVLEEKIFVARNILCFSIYKV